LDVRRVGGRSFGGRADDEVCWVGYVDDETGGGMVFDVEIGAREGIGPVGDVGLGLRRGLGDGPDAAIGGSQSYHWYVRCLLW